MKIGTVSGCCIVCHGVVSTTKERWISQKTQSVNNLIEFHELKYSLRLNESQSWSSVQDHRNCFRIRRLPLESYASICWMEESPLGNTIRRCTTRVDVATANLTSWNLLVFGTLVVTILALSKSRSPSRRQATFACPPFWFFSIIRTSNVEGNFKPLSTRNGTLFLSCGVTLNTGGLCFSDALLGMNW